MKIIENPFLCDTIRNVEMNLFYFGYASVDNHWAGKHISFNFSYLYYIIDGEAQIRGLDGTLTHLKKGKWYLIPAGYSFEYSCEREMEHLFFHLQLCDIDGRDLLGICPVPQSIPSQGEPVFLRQCASSDSITDGLKMRQIVFGVLLSILEQNQIEITVSDFSPCVRKAIQYIRQNLSIHLTISEIAEHVFVSESTLTKRFRKELSVSVNDYIFNTVMAEAERLVRKKDRSILEISEKYGFSDQFYFSRRFKDKFGKSPREYRKNMLF